MNSSVKEKWVEALRSGKYEQGDSQLRTDDGTKHCCLGVLCELYRDEVGGEWVLTEHGPAFTDAEDNSDTSTLPRGVQKWAGLEFKNPNVDTDRDTVSTLASMNDGPYSFDEIADQIEEDF